MYISGGLYRAKIEVFAVYLKGEEQMNKKELVGKVAEKTGIMKRDVEIVTDAILEEIKETLAADGKVQLMGFGSFEVRSRAARNGKNPRTGEAIRMPEVKLPAFKAGKLLKDAVR
ncbi:HU family DNA-binding protein [Christensenella tenuis]|jgi:nucleoid DNA-binding protein|nr:HU family DNA-binding protein [Christensenella tenuis]